MARKRLDNNIRDVAKEAGVSATTVSHALNGKGRVRPATRERIRSLASDMGYVPNPQARGLKTGRSMTILADLPGASTASSLRSAFIGELLIAAAQTALEAGYLLTVSGRSLPEPRTPPRRDGALIIDPDDDHPLPLGTPFVTVGQLEASAQIGPSVDHDYEAGMTEVLDHLRDAGYTRPALLSTSGDFSYARSSLAGYERWIVAAGAPRCVEAVDGTPDLTAGQAGAQRLLVCDPQPDAIVATTEWLATGALRAVEEAQLRAGPDVGLASMDDSDRLRSAETPVTSLDLRPAEVGRRAVALLISALRANTKAPQARVVVDSELLVRGSTNRHATSG